MNTKLIILTIILIIITLTLHHTLLHPYIPTNHPFTPQP